MKKVLWCFLFGGATVPKPVHHHESGPPGRYPPEAYQFVRDALDYTVHRINADEEGVVHDRHVTGQQLCLGMRDYALRQYGRLARLVFEQWNVRRTEDFGRIVYGLIEAGLLAKTAEDSIEDFDDVFDFAEAFDDVSVI